jgi:hypothetical protein
MSIFRTQKIVIRIPESKLALGSGIFLIKPDVEELFPVCKILGVISIFKALSGIGIYSGNLNIIGYCLYHGPPARG